MTEKTNFQNLPMDMRKYVDTGLLPHIGFAGMLGYLLYGLGKKGLKEVPLTEVSREELMELAIKEAKEVTDLSAKALEGMDTLIGQVSELHERRTVVDGIEKELQRRKAETNAKLEQEAFEAAKPGLDIHLEPCVLENDHAGFEAKLTTSFASNIRALAKTPFGALRKLDKLIKNNEGLRNKLGLVKDDEKST